MNPFPLAYRVLGSVALAAGLPVFALGAAIAGRHLKGLGQRLGRYRREPVEGRPRIWIHAASVGEAGVAAAIVESFWEMVPAAGIVVSTTTVQGNDHARQRIGDRARIVLAPLDAWPAVRGALAAFAPDALVCVETEIWPNWFWQATRCGVATAFVNGRLSQRSFDRYRKIRPLIAPVLADVDLFSMIADPDARRIQALGAPAPRVTVNGNAKYDQLAARHDPQVPQALAARFGLAANQPVVVAGSIRGDEDRIVLEAFATLCFRFADAVLFIVPRHIQRAPAIVAKARQMGFSCQLRSALDHQPRQAQVVVVDTIGELFDLYSIASVVFCGASLVPLGGQNVLEPAAWAKPVVFGPFMDDFAEAADLLVAGDAAMRVADGDGLATVLAEVLDQPARAAAMGQKAKALVMAGQGAARRHAEAIRELLTRGQPVRDEG